MIRRTGGVLVLIFVLVLAAACSSHSGRRADQGAQSSQPPSASGPNSEPKTEPTGSGTTGPTRDPKAKPQADAAKASPGGFTVRYLKDGKVEKVDVPDFEH